jgi:hypothetical protein
LDEVKAACDSELERTWPDVVAGCEAALPSHAQKLIEPCSAPAYTAIWIDGPAHDSGT